MAIGTIKSLSIVDDQIVAIIETGPGPAVTATIMQAAGVECHPCVGDTVVFSQQGQEVVVTALFSTDTDTVQGETLIFSRNAAGEVVASIRLSASGQVTITPTTTAGVGNGSDFVAMATVTDQKVQAILDAISGAAVGSADGGAAFKTNIVAALNISLPLIGSVASTNLKAD